jgi:hypothetical protein
VVAGGVVVALVVVGEMGGGTVDVDVDVAKVDALAVTGAEVTDAALVQAAARTDANARAATERERTMAPVLHRTELRCARW